MRERDGLIIIEGGNRGAKARRGQGKEKGKTEMRTETIVLNEKRNVTLTAYIQGTGGEFRFITKRPAVLVLPGGGYQFCSEREADPVAMAYLKAGYQALILRYSVKEDAVWPNPLDDYEQAMELIRGRAKEWGIYPDKIAVVGFSAGGHLAAAAATMAKNRPNAAILGYAVTGPDVKGCNPSAPDTTTAVDKDTCPCFLFATRTDNVVPIENSISFMSALTEAGVAFESHIYAYGPHGFSTCDTSVQSIDTEICVRVPGWVEDSIGWLRDVLGDFGEGCMTEPICRVHVTGDYEAFLSVDCTMRCLMRHPAARAIVDPVVKEMMRAPGIPERDGNMDEIVKKMRLRDLMGYANVSEEAIEELNEKLLKIPNSEG